MYLDGGMLYPVKGTTALDDRVDDYKKYNDFTKYFNYIINYLDQQIDMCDRKSSLLLSQGKFWTVFGFIFYFIAIVAWQILFFSFHHKIEFIYGILSTSFLFILIEFFSSWYLRQYKQFVDTSTYLVRIKSILQRYILAYFALKDGNEKNFDVSPIITMLQEEIKWPETYLLKRPDVNFAKECLETATNLIKSLQDKDKNKCEK